MFLHIGQINGYNYLNGSLSTTPTGQTEIYKDNTSCWPFWVHCTPVFHWRLLFTFWKCVLATQCYIIKSGSTVMLMSVFPVLISVWTKSVCFLQTTCVKHGGKQEEHTGAQGAFTPQPKLQHVS